MVQHPVTEWLYVWVIYSVRIIQYYVIYQRRVYHSFFTAIALIKATSTSITLHNSSGCPPLCLYNLWMEIVCVCVWVYIYMLRWNYNKGEDIYFLPNKLELDLIYNYKRALWSLWMHITNMTNKTGLLTSWTCLCET